LPDVDGTCRQVGSYDVERLVEALRAAGGDPEQCRDPGKLDPDRAIAAMIAQELTPSRIFARPSKSA
jgi:hypothetical protein